ncbi:MAG: F0F1 ATP synthase subunit delta [Kiritimatiellia bacterium]
MMKEIFLVAAPMMGFHLVLLVGILLLVRVFMQASARQAVARVREVEEEVRKREANLRLEIEQHERDLADRKAEAERQMESLQDEAKREAAHIKERALSEAKKDAQKIIEQAQANEKKMRDQISREMEEKAVDYGGRIFHLVFSDLLTKEMNAVFTGELIDALNEIESGSVTVDTADAQITTSHNLPEEVQTRLTEVLREKFHKDASLTENLDEALLAGVVLKMGSLEIDGSLLNRYREAVREVQKAVHHSES